MVVEAHNLCKKKFGGEEIAKKKMAQAPFVHA